MRREPTSKKDSTPQLNPRVAWRLVDVVPLSGYRMQVTFVDGTEGLVDMSKLIVCERAGVFAPLRDADEFGRVRLEYGVATWPNGADLAPDAMHEAIRAQGQWVPGAAQ